MKYSFAYELHRRVCARRKLLPVQDLEEIEKQWLFFHALKKNSWDSKVTEYDECDVNGECLK